MTNTELLEKVIEESGYKKSYIAKTIGITRYCLTRKIRNENEFKASEIIMLCNLLGINDTMEKERIFFAKKVECKSTF